MVFKRLFLGAFAFAFLALPAFAQETTSAIRGTVVGASGAGVVGASVSITHEPSGSISTQTTNSNGIFLARNLRVGGPYSIVVAGAGGNAKIADAAKKTALFEQKFYDGQFEIFDSIEEAKEWSLQLLGDHLKNAGL